MKQHMCDWIHETFELDEPGFMMDIIVTGEDWEAWLYLKDYSVKSFLAGGHVRDAIKEYGGTVFEWAEALEEYCLNTDQYTTYEEDYVS